MIIIRKQKYFNDENDPSSVPTGVKVLGGLAATAGAFYGAKKGVFGAGAREWAGKTWARAGKAVGNSSMMESGLKDATRGRSGISAWTGQDEIASKLKNNYKTNFNAMKHETGIGSVIDNGKVKYTSMAGGGVSDKLINSGSGNIQGPIRPTNINSEAKANFDLTA